MLTFSTIFMVFTCKYQIKKVKRSVKRMLADGDIDYSKTVIFSETEIETAVWVEPREFRLNGVMFDIYKTDTIYGKLYYHCFEDQNETAWAELLQKSSEQDIPKNNKEKGKHNPLKYLMKDITLQNSNQLLALNYLSLTAHLNDVDCLKPQYFYNNILAPPEA